MKLPTDLVRGAAALLAMLVVAVMLPQQGRAELQIDITRGRSEPLRISIVPFDGASADDRRYGSQIAEVVQADLESSGLFRAVAPGALAQNVSFNETPNFGSWRALNTQGLVMGQVEPRQDGRLQVNFRLWDVAAGEQMVGRSFQTPPANWRRVAHIIADAIYERLTGESGYFDSRIVYVAESGPAQDRVKRLAIMDQDGANHRFLTDGGNLVLTPRFSPTRQEITYLSYGPSGPRVHLLNIDTGQRETLGEFPGMTFAPRFSPDGDTIVLSMSQNGNSDIYEMDLRTRNSRRLTDHSAIDTSPSYSPDGRQIVFNSDRGGAQQLYVMSSSGGNVKRISFGNGRYATPVWSPRGDLIAFTKMEGGRFYIGVMRPDGSGERLLTESYMEEGPTWSPNGRVIMFFRQRPSDANGRGGSSTLYAVDVTGENLREVRTPQDASDPAWSPLSP